jgi:hypothetical protein
MSMEFVDVERYSAPSFKGSRSFENLTHSKTSSSSSTVLSPLDPLVVSDCCYSECFRTYPLAPGQIYPVNNRPYSITRSTLFSDSERRKASVNSISAKSAFTTASQWSDQTSRRTAKNRLSNAISVNTDLKHQYGLLMKLFAFLGILIPPFWIAGATIAHFIVRDSLDDLQADEYLLGTSNTLPQPTVWCWDTVKSTGTIKFWIWLNELLGLVAFVELSALIIGAILLILL